MSYKVPNVYVESVPYKGNAPTTNSNSIMGMVGLTPMGDTTQAILVTSWSEYIEKFALTFASPFMANSDLSHAVYGFFQNGGSLLYIVRVVGSGSAKAKATLSVSNGDILIEAKSVGAWGNNIYVEVVDNSDNDANNPFLLNVYYGQNTDPTLVESFLVNNDVTSQNYFEYVVERNSEYITIVNDKQLGLIAATKKALTGGSDDLDGVKDEDYVNALTKFDSVHNLAAIGIPGQSTSAIISGIKTYTKNKPILPVFEPSTYTDVATIISNAKTNTKGTDSTVYGPQLIVADPLSVVSKTIEISCVGHIMGVIARTIDTQGEWNAAAGTEAVVKGALGVAKTFTDAERGSLNDAGINVIVNKPNYGVVIWGARSQSSDPELKYVSNLTLNHTLRRNIKDEMERFEFKNNGPSLWVDITSAITGMLETKRLAGAFAGTTPETCYYVKCDSSNNTQSTIDKGQVIVEVGYAANKPAEFIIVRVAHQLSK